MTTSYPARKLTAARQCLRQSIVRAARLGRVRTRADVLDALETWTTDPTRPVYVAVGDDLEARGAYRRFVDAIVREIAREVEPSALERRATRTEVV